GAFNRLENLEIILNHNQLKSVPTGVFDKRSQ
uniref:Variable lymphocyte receptor B cassette n=1 Tax=Petromyzon marinus TaxID=7757 RepID=S4R926_PETMA